MDVLANSNDVSYRSTRAYIYVMADTFVRRDPGFFEFKVSTTS